MRNANAKALDILTHFVTEVVIDDVPDLSSRQLAIMLHVYHESGMHTVRGLSADLSISKPAVTRALDTLGRYGLVKRLRDDSDRRNVFVGRTPRGDQYVHALSDCLARAMHEADQHDGMVA